MPENRPTYGGGHIRRFYCIFISWLPDYFLTISWQHPAGYSVHHCAKKSVTTMLTYPWKCTVLHCNHLGNTWKPLVLMAWHFDYCPSASEGDNQSVRSSAPVVSRCFPGGYNVKLYISRGRLAWWLLAFLHSVIQSTISWSNCRLVQYTTMFVRLVDPCITLRRKPLTCWQG